MPTPLSTSRHFTMAYKRRILKEYAACTAPGEKAALLRREQLRVGYIHRWTQQLGEPAPAPAPPADTSVCTGAGARCSLAEPSPPPAPSLRPQEDPRLCQRVQRLESEVLDLRKCLARALLIAEIQGKIVQLLQMDR